MPEEEKDLEKVEAEKLGEVDQVVDEISRHESDELIRDEDAKLAAAFSPVTSTWGKIKQWFGIKRNRYIVVGVGVGLLALVIIVPPLKFGLLNSLGVRGSANVVVLDGGSGLPLRNVKVEINDISSVTDVDGRATLSGLRLGSTELMVQKLAYSTSTQKITITSGSNDFGSVSLDPVGVQFTVNISNWLSKEPIVGGEVSYGENSVFSNESGVAVLTIPPTEEAEIEIKIVAANYRNEKVVVTTDSKDSTTVAMVLDKPDFFFSNKSGKFNLLKVDLDGQNSEVLMLGTGKENDETQLVELAKSRALFVVSTREGKHNSEGSQLYGLFHVDSVTGDFEKIDESESLRMYGISDGRLIYMKVKAGASGEDPERQRLIAYDPISGTSLELAASNYFNSVALTDGYVYYAPSDFYNSQKEAFLFKTDPISAEKTTVHPDEVWSIFRTGYNELIINAKQDWYKVSTLTGAVPSPLEGKPNDTSIKLYQTSPDAKSAIWVDNRDGKGHIILLNLETEEEKSIHSQSGIRHPLRWLDDDHIIYRVSTDSETADYILHIGTGNYAKITDASDVSSYDRWYYYYQ